MNFKIQMARNYLEGFGFAIVLTKGFQKSFVRLNAIRKVFFAREDLPE